MSENDYDDVVYYAENMFGFDLNEDGIMGQPSGDTSSYYKLNELEGFADLGFTTFDDTENFINLYLDRGNGDIYFGEKPTSILQAAMEVNGNLENVMALHSLSKRSNLPGFRSGCATGDQKIISAYAKYRAFHGVSVPLPIQNASVLAWQDDAMVEKNRAAYQEKFTLAEEILDKDNLTPEGAFYLWLKVADAEVFAKKLYDEEQVIVLPGKYLGAENNGVNPAEQYLRIALVHDIELTTKALNSIKKVLDNE